jgi:hypothetical protein
MKQKEHDYKVFQKMVEEMVNTDTILTNTGIFEYKSKKYILIAEIQQVKG